MRCGRWPALALAVGVAAGCFPNGFGGWDARSLEARLRSLPHASRRLHPFYYAYEDGPQAVRILPLAGRRYALVLVEALEDSAFLCSLGQVLEADEVDTTREYGGLIMRVGGRLQVHPLESRLTVPDDNSYVLPLHSGPSIMEFHCHSGRGGPAPGPSLTDLVVMRRRIDRVGQAYFLVVSRFADGQLNVDLCGGDRTRAAVVDLGVYPLPCHSAARHPVQNGTYGKQ